MAEDPALSGVPLSRYAAVLAYTGAGVPLDQSLDHAGISAEEWPLVEEGWALCLAESAAVDGALIAACDAHRAAADAHVERPIPPLDAELRAFFDFFRAFTAAADPLGFLGARGLVEVDVFRLLGAWQARIAAEETIRDEAAAILVAPPGPAPEVQPAPPRLLEATRWPRRGLPKASLAQTAVALPDLSKLPLPFVKPGIQPVVLPPSPPIRPRIGLGDTAPAFTAPIAPALPFPGPPPPAPPPPAPPPPPPPVIAPRPTPLAETSLDTFAPLKPALPFAPEAPPKAPAPLAETSLATFEPAKPALPFAEAKGPQLTLSAYATMSAEITASPAAALATIARYGLTPETKRAEDAAWQAKFAAEPAVRMAWMRELIEAGNRLRGGR